MEFVRVLFLGLLSWVPIDLTGLLLIVVGSTNTYLLPLAAIGGAAIYAKTCCLGIWLAWGQSSALWRSIVVLLILAPNVLILELPGVSLVAIGAAVGSALLRLLGYSRVNIYETAATLVSTQMAGRFRLVDLFAWNAMAAICVSAALWLTPSVDALQFAVFGTLACIAFAISPLAIWTALFVNKPSWSRIFFALTMSVMLGGLLAWTAINLWQWPQPGSSVNWARIVIHSLLLVAGTVTAIIALLALAVRADGVRIVRRGEVVTTRAHDPAITKGA